MGDLKESLLELYDYVLNIIRDKISSLDDQNFDRIRDCVEIMNMMAVTILLNEGDDE